MFFGWARARKGLHFIPQNCAVKTSEPEVLSILDVIRIGSLQCEPAWSEVKKTIPRVPTRHIYKPLTQETVGNAVLCSASQSLCRSRGAASSWGIQKWMSRDSQIFWLSHSRTGWHWWHLRQIQLHRDVFVSTKAPGHNQDFQGDDYELVGHNCCSFARANGREECRPLPVRSCSSCGQRYS